MWNFRTVYRAFATAVFGLHRIFVAVRIAGSNRKKCREKYSESAALEIFHKQKLSLVHRKNRSMPPTHFGRKKNDQLKLVGYYNNFIFWYGHLYSRGHRCVAFRSSCKPMGNFYHCVFNGLLYRLNSCFI